MADPFNKHSKKFDRRGIGPMKVLEDQQNWQSCRARLEVTHQGFERLRASLRKA